MLELLKEFLSMPMIILVLICLFCPPIIVFIKKTKNKIDDKILYMVIKAFFNVENEAILNKDMNNLNKKSLGISAFIINYFDIFGKNPSKKEIKVAEFLFAIIASELKDKKEVAKDLEKKVLNSKEN